MHIRQSTYSFFFFPSFANTCYCINIQQPYGRDFMVGEHFSRTQQKWACVQFIAEVSLIANCKPSDLKLALTLIADLANSENNETEDDIFYKAD